MRPIGTRFVRVRTLAALATVLLVSVPSSGAFTAASTQEQPEIRALWVLRTSLISPESIDELVGAARAHGFNTLLVQVRGRGDAYYTSALEPPAAELQRQPPDFDPLATVLERARGAGLSVHAWVNVNLVSSAVDLPISRTHIVLRHPAWLMVPRELAQELARVTPASPSYVGRLARWTRGQPEEIEGLYASPVVPAAARHVEAVVRDIAKRYAVDGVHLDYARYPSNRFDYSAAALAEFRAAVRPTLSATQRRELDDRERVDLFAYADGLPDAWKAFRIARMTALMTKLRGAVKSVRPDALVTLAAAPDLDEAINHKLQDWPAWLRGGIVDAVAPMAYTPEANRFAEQIAAARDIAGGKSVWAGIGAYRLTAAQTVENIRTARRLGTAGVVLFSYDSLIDPRQANANYLATVGKAAFPRSGPVDGSR
jgi:uncharacterized lipoprotein YddW (UPF0748 family)